LQDHQTKDRGDPIADVKLRLPAHIADRHRFEPPAKIVLDRDISPDRRL
jgi:hypothetical protein